MKTEKKDCATPDHVSGSTFPAASTRPQLDIDEAQKMAATMLGRELKNHELEWIGHYLEDLVQMSQFIGPTIKNALILSLIR